MAELKRYAVVGTGGRSIMFLDAIAGTYRAHSQLVGFCDPSPTRMAWHNRRLNERFQTEPVPTYEAARFDDMIREQRPDVVIVASVDATHHVYVIRAMELGCDVICEKPLTTTAAWAQQILDAIERTGRNLTVTFNMRYSPMAMVVKQLLHEGAIGTPLAVDMRWMLDTTHGSDYFRRWHATKDNSGGLLVHKSTHHFDLINWWLNDWPDTVVAQGGLMFYGRKNAEARGEHYSYDRYTGNPEAKNDPFALNLDDPALNNSSETPNLLRGLYLEAEAESGYVRDRNVFGDHVDIEDTMGLLVRYRRGALLNYSLVAYSPWEGFQVAISGTKGRIEITQRYDRTGVLPEAGDNAKKPAAPQPVKAHQQVVVHPLFGTPRNVEVPTVEGGHGGADPQLMEQLFASTPAEDPLGRAAGHLDGCASLLIGACANESIRIGQVVKCDDLLPLPDNRLVNA